MRDLYRLSDQTGRTWLVTGATSGIGREAALAASRAGARLLVPARNAERACALSRQLPGPSRTFELDLADLDSVRAAAAHVDEPIDVLLNNAGGVTTHLERTALGHERMLATNFFGPFAFTNLIADRLRERVVIVGSGIHVRGVVDVHDPDYERRRWSIASAYGQSKLADMLWGLELERRLRDRGIDVQLAHPGWALTNLANASRSARLNAVVTAVSRSFAQSAQSGAQSLLVAATADLPPCSYIGPGGLGGQRGSPTLAGRAPRAADRQAARAVWELGVAKTGTDLPD